MGRPPATPVPAGRPLTTRSLHELGAVLGGFRWLELQLFAILGAAVRDTDDRAAKVTLAAHSLHAGWRADQWLGRLPATHDLDPETLVRAPSGAVATVVGEVAAAAPGARRQGTHAVLMPALADAYRRALDAAPAAAGAPVARVLRRVVADLEADLAEAAVVLAAAGPQDAADVARWRAALAAAGGPDPVA